MSKPLGYRSTALDALRGADLSGKVAVVTGGNSGIGVETVRALAHAGADVTLCSRSAEAGQRVAAELQPGAKGKISVQQLDLADLSSIKAAGEALAASLPRLDLLILNAGVMACPEGRTKDGFEMQVGLLSAGAHPMLAAVKQACRVERRSVKECREGRTKDGFEMQIGTNHFGHFYLTQLLLPKMKASGGPGRIVAVSSTAHTMGKLDVEDLNWERRKYSAWGSYGQSKLANILFVKELAHRLGEEGSPLAAFALHPGVIKTPLQRHMGWEAAIMNFLGGPFMKSTQQGAATSVYAATAAELDGQSGAYLADCKVASPSKAAQDGQTARALWDKTEQLLGAALAKAGLA